MSRSGNDEYVLQFRMEFHSPFHVGSGVADQGLARVLDRENPLPSTSLKGLMRAAASERLCLDARLLEGVFGSAATPIGGRRQSSPWRWSDAAIKDESVTRTARIRISEDGVTDRGFLMFGESLWVKDAAFTVELTRLVPTNELDAHRLVLRACALAIDGIGGGRRRGEGWVHVTQQDDEGRFIAWTQDDSNELLALREAS